MYRLPTLAIVVAGSCAGLFAVLAILFWIFGTPGAPDFVSHWMRITIPGWPLTVLIIAAVQASRMMATHGTGKSWPWVIPVFALGVVADFTLKQQDLAQHANRVAASAIIGTIVYVFFFSRWFRGK